MVGDGSHYGGYSEVGELHAEHQATMGTMAHELGHDLGMPDLYDIDDSDGASEGVGKWSIMGSGNWNYVSGWHGSSPAYLDPFLKSYQGWLTPIEVNDTLNNQTIAQAETNAVAYRLGPNPGGVDWEFYETSGTGEYYLVENRQNEAGAGYDDGLPYCGILIWHIDESVTSTNHANADENHPLVALEQADGRDDLQNGVNRGDSSDPYPGTLTKKIFSTATYPNTNLYSGARSNVIVKINTYSCSSSMPTDLIIGEFAPAAFTKFAPANTAIDQPASLTLDWLDAPNATSYDYCLETPANGTCSTWTAGLTRSQVTVTGLTPGASYEWQVRAVNSGGSTEADSTTLWSFSTADLILDQHLFLPCLSRPPSPGNLIIESFESNLMPPTGWSLDRHIPTSTWIIGTKGSPHSGSYYADTAYDYEGEGQNELLLSPAFFTHGGTVSFFSASDITSCRDYFLEDCDLEVWVVKGDWSWSDDIRLGEADSAWMFSWTYTQSIFDFTAYVSGGQTIRIGFRYTSGDLVGAGIMLDDITIKY